MTDAAAEVGWDADPTLTRPAPFAPLTATEASADAVVVGLGGSGLAAVHELVSRGLDVIGLDAGRIARGAAGRNGGILAPGGAFSFREAVERFGADAALDLWQRTSDELAWLAQRLGPEVIRRPGVLRLAGLPGPVDDDVEAAERQREIADLTADAQSMRAHGLAVESYEGELGRGLFVPGCGATNPAARAFGLADQLRDGARLHEHTPVTSVARGQVRTRYGTVTAGLVVVAVDGRLDLLLPQLAPHVRTVRLQMLATAPLAYRRLPCPVSARWGFEYGQQDAADRLLVGGGRDRYVDAEETTDDRPTPPVQQRIEHIATRLAGGDVHVTHRWAASAGYTRDSRPVCALVDDGVVACGGYSGSGNLVGAVAARAAVALALDAAPVPAYFRADVTPS